MKATIDFIFKEYPIPLLGIIGLVIMGIGIGTIIEDRKIAKKG